MRTKALTASRIWSAAFMLLAMSGNPSAVAKDLNALAAFVAPAYTAMNFAVVCTPHDPVFLSQTSGPRGNALAYAEHVKDEAIVSLSHDEAAVALKAAADTARDIALRTLRAFNAQDRAIEQARIAKWCESDARQFILAFIEHHDANHETLLSRIEQARQ
jgi:hypothetical protein